MPKLGQLIRTPAFSKKIKQVNIDEAHFIYTAGIEKYGLPPFRPAWGKLDEVRSLLPKTIPFLAMSGTLPPRIKTYIAETLMRPKYLAIDLTSNQPNIVYAARPITTAFTDWSNLDFVIPYDFDPEDPARRK